MKYTHTFFIVLIFPLFISMAPSICSDNVEGVDQSVQAVVSEASSEPVYKAVGTQLASGVKAVLSNVGVVLLGGVASEALSVCVKTTIRDNLPSRNNLTDRQQHDLWCQISDIRPFLLWAGCTMLGQSYGNYLLNGSRVVSCSRDNLEEKIGKVLAGCVRRTDMFLGNGGISVAMGFLMRMYGRMSPKCLCAETNNLMRILSLGIFVSQLLYNVSSCGIRKLYCSHCANLESQKNEALSTDLAGPSGI